LLESAKLLEKTLHAFGVRGKVTQVQPGPVITRYEIEPAAGQKVAPIASLSDDLALALKARSIRIEAPIPGKAAVGIEVPNAHPKMVRLGSLLESSEYNDSDSPLSIALGRTISGEPFCASLDRMPHVLVAGATGAGKSVCINTIITSIVYRAGPEDVRFVMVDPKMLELMAYEGLPHVIPPIVTQPKEAAKILKWAVGEMEARYRTLAHVGVRSIADYNRRIEGEGGSKMPYLVVIVDELADLMLSNQKNEIEDHIARLAQMARAVGIHLVVATQRPSVDVITGVIKANFPSRIAFQVPTRTDSRTILDSIGAEKLLGKGDMLYLGTGMAAPLRVHGSYLSTEETNDVVEWLKNRNPQPVTAEENASPLDEGNELFPMEREDDLFEEAARILVAHQQGSISLLQRRLKVGYARAARLVDMMEEAGIVGPFTGSKAREILVPTVEDLEKLLAGMQRAPFSGRQG
ncbi:DNA translocase FtsK, partial [bacterium]|nr:DNA translocase FtsK [bacterium]